tara:strand:- start:40 stop:261 length:222 start_codon:yes stop_codon:yes gene_type:complete
MFGWIKRLINKTVSSYEPVKPKTTTITIKDLKNKTKKELERIGRKLGIELDRRLSKTKLVNRIKFRAKLKRKK